MLFLATKVNLQTLKEKVIPNLLLKRLFFTWKNRKQQLEEDFKMGKISCEEYEKFSQENQDYYVKNFYNEVLKPLNPQEVYQTLGDDVVLLCYEKPTQFCHRFLVASWLELSLGVTIDEWGFENDLDVKENKEKLKQELIKYIENNRDMEKF